MSISNERLANILADAFEGVTAYWCNQITINEEPEAPEGIDLSYASDILAYGGTITLFVGEPGDEDPGHEIEYRISTPHLQRAMEILRTEAKWKDVWERLCEDGDYDSCDADILVQLAAFGEVVYG